MSVIELIGWNSRFYICPNVRSSVHTTPNSIEGYCVIVRVTLETRAVLVCDYSSHDQQPCGHLSSYRVNVSNLCHVCVEFVKTVSKYKQICRIIRKQLFKKRLS